MPDKITYELRESIATITLDDGKVNALTLERIAEIHAVLDRALADQAIVVLSGRAGTFCAGFDLRALMAGGADALGLVRAGFELSIRMLTFPRPIVIACTGHAIAMGAFLLLSGDYRVGAAGPNRITANEVMIGLTMPRAAIEISRQRLAPAAFNRAMILAEVFSPEDAVHAGFLDRVVPAAELVDVARNVALEYTKLSFDAHAATKLRVREAAILAIRAGIEADERAFQTA